MAAMNSRRGIVLFISAGSSATRGNQATNMPGQGDLALIARICPARHRPALVPGMQRSASSWCAAAAPEASRHRAWESGVIFLLPLPALRGERVVARDSMRNGAASSVSQSVYPVAILFAQVRHARLRWERVTGGFRAAVSAIALPSTMLSLLQALCVGLHQAGSAGSEPADTRTKEGDGCAAPSAIPDYAKLHIDVVLCHSKNAKKRAASSPRP